MIEHGRYDLALEIGDRIARVQCKWGRHCGDVVKVNLTTSRPACTRSTATCRGKYGIDEIDAVAVYCGELDEFFLIPIEEAAGRSAIHLRLTPAQNNQRAAINFAADYEFSGAVAQLARALPWHGRGRRFESGQLHLSHPDVEAVGADEFGRTYARFLQRAAAGESFVVTRRGRPMARVSPPDPSCGNPGQAV